MAKLYNLAKMLTSTVGTGAVTLGAAASGFTTFAAAGASDQDVVTYIIIEGANTEIGRGTYTASGTTLSRDTVLNSSAGGAKITLAGSAVVSITAAAEDFPHTGAATIDFGAAPGTNIATVTITGQPQIYATSQITAWISGMSSTASHNATEHAIMPLAMTVTPTAIVVGTGFTLTALTQLRLTGTIQVNWSWI